MPVLPSVHLPLLRRGKTQLRTLLYTVTAPVVCSTSRLQDPAHSGKLCVPVATCFCPIPRRHRLLLHAAVFWPQLHRSRHLYEQCLDCHHHCPPGEHWQKHPGEVVERRGWWQPSWNTAIILVPNKLYLTTPESKHFLGVCPRPDWVLCQIPAEQLGISMEQTLTKSLDLKYSAATAFFLQWKGCLNICKAT